MVPQKPVSGRDKLLLIDGNSILYRAFFALPGLTTSRGLYTNAVYGFATMLLTVLRSERPTHIAVAFDKGKMTFRHAVYPEYKGTRQKTPGELTGQFSMARELLDHLNMRYIELDTFEADDIIGTLAARDGGERCEVVAVSGDRDLLQLVRPDVTVCLTRKGMTDLVRYDDAAVRERYALSPAQIVDLKGLMGDSSDNIPGVPGIGEKTAIKLLTQFSTIEELLEHIDEVAGDKLREKLRLHRQDALTSKQLATIKTDVPLADRLEDLRFEGLDLEAARAIFREYEFKSLIDRIPDWAARAGGEAALPATMQPGAERAQAEVLSAPEQAADVAQTRAEAAPPSTAAADVRIVEWAEVSQTLKAWRTPVAVLLDLRGDYQTGELCGVAFASRDGAVYAPLHEHDRRTSADFVHWLGQADASKVVFDVKAMLVAGTRHGWWTSVQGSVGGAFDTLLGTYLVHASEGEPTLVDAITRALPDVRLPEWVHSALDKRCEQTPAALATCASLLVVAGAALQHQLAELQLMALYEDVEFPLATVLAQLELRGVRVDTAQLQEIGNELSAGIERLTQSIHELAGESFNINSTQQLGRILFDKMGLPPVKKTKTGYSTSADVLEKLAPQSDFVAQILEYRQLAKLRSTYVDGLLAVVREPDSRVHTSFRQAMTATGRLSSQNPNLQNIPIRMEQGRRLRRAFIPTEPDWLMVSADYSQVELRILAHLSGDAALIDAFVSGVDIHTRTAADVFEVPVEDVTPLLRRQAKAVNFGIVYGISDYGLSQNLGITRPAAARIIEQYFAKFPDVKRYLEESIARARELGYAETLLGRRRYLPQIHSRNFNERSFAERTAMNTPIQGSQADVIKVAMVRLERLLQDTFVSRMLLQVHDELIFEGPAHEFDELARVVREEMETAVVMRVPLKVDIHAGATWYDAK